MSNYAGTLACEVSKEWYSAPLFALSSNALCMTRRIVYPAIGLLVCMLGFQYWQHQQAQQTLLKVQLLDLSLQLANERARTTAENILEGMATAVAKNQNQVMDLRELQISKEIHAKTEKALNLFPTMRKMLASHHGRAQALGDEEIASHLQQGVNEYMVFIKSFESASDFRSYSELELYKSKFVSRHGLTEVLADASKEKNFYYGRAPLEAELAMLTQKEFELRLHEVYVLREQAEKIGTAVNTDYRPVPK